MKLGKYRTCNGCRCLTYEGKCELGFGQDFNYDKGALTRRNIRPAEPCLKARTNDDYVAAREARRTI